jgi:hypothetical protein
MIKGSNKIDWESLHRLVDPAFNLPSKDIGTKSYEAEIAVRIDSESSMAKLTGEQKTIVNRLLDRYAAVTPQQRQECEQQIKQYIIEQYNKDNCELVLMSSLPKNGKPEKGKLYVEKNGAKLRYIVEAPNGNVVDKTLDFFIKGTLTNVVLQNHKYGILENTTTRSDTPIGPAIFCGQKLPLAYERSRDLIQAEKEAYYKNPWHSAYRYFNFKVDSKPNPWQHPNASHMGSYTNADTGAQFSGPTVSDQQMQLIHAMWFALNDGEFAISDMHTHESAKAELIKTFGSLGRAHNWDNTRPVYEDYMDPYGRPARRQKTRYRNDGTLEYVTEEYDDMQADKPSCPWGVETRLTQFVMLALKQDANERILREGILRDKFKEELIGSVKGKNTLFNTIDKMNIATLDQLKDTLDDLVLVNCGDYNALDKKQKEILENTLPYNTQDLTMFLRGCMAFFGDYRFTNKLKNRIEYFAKHFDNYGKLTLYFATNPWGVFYDAINERIAQRKEDLGSTPPTQDAKKLDSYMPNAASAQDVAVVRQQLLDLAVRTINLQLLHQLQAPSVSADFIRTKAAELKSQLQPIAAPAAPIKSTEVAKQPVSKVEAKVWPNMKEQLIQYSIENQLFELVPQLLDATNEQVTKIMETLGINLANDVPQGDVSVDDDANELQAALNLSKELNRQAEMAQQEQRQAELARARATPAPILNAFNAIPVQQSNASIGLLPQIVAKFANEPIKQQLLANLNSNPQAVQILNQNAHGIVETLIHNVEKNANMTARLVQLTPAKMVQFLTGLQAKAQPTATPSTSSMRVKV